MKLAIDLTIQNSFKGLNQIKSINDYKTLLTCLRVNHQLFEAKAHITFQYQTHIFCINNTGFKESNI